MKTSWWYESGMAAQAAQELVWFGVIVVVGSGIMAWRDMKEESKQQDKPRTSRNVHKGERK